ncbi:VOC family protein [Nocardiopsis alba]|uniref:VOC family protein n=1 Tax=Nocardiopsis alba TaxID=53437 RepID=UPI00366CC842
MKMTLTGTDTAPPRSPAGLNAIHHVGISVSDLERSVGWYERALGMVRWMDETFEGGRTAGLMRPGTMLYLGITQHDECGDEDFSPRRRGLDHLTFAAGSREELKEWQSHLIDLGVECSALREYVEPIPFALFTFTDPDGVALEAMHIGA